MADLKWEDLPPEIQERMLDCQEEQSRTRNPEDFKQEIQGGFIFEKTKEGHTFWSIILCSGDIDHFYTLYPKESTSTVNKFKKGDYIVTLIDKGTSGKKNYCSKQREDSNFLAPEIDTENYKNNLNSNFEFKDKSNTKWRFATPEEAAEYERIGKPYDVTTLNKPQFIVGKWYKFAGWYLKYLKHNGEIWQASEYICDDKIYHQYTSVASFGTNDSVKILLEDLSEIQPYLPDGHPDKIVKVEPHEIANKSLVGRYFKVLKKFNTNVKKGDYLKITEDLGENSNNCYTTEKYGALDHNRIKNKEVELMPEGFNPEDVEWITFRNYLPSLPKSYTVPEYVEWIDFVGSGGTGKMCAEYEFKKGKIFHTKTDSLPPCGLIRNEWKKALTEDWYLNNFKSSTKEAYDAQFNSKELPEKWFIRVTSENVNNLNKYLQSNSHKYPHYESTWAVTLSRDGYSEYFYSEEPNYACHTSNSIFSGFKEITFEQFKKYVLKDDTSNWTENELETRSFFIGNPCVEIPLKPSVEVELYIKPKQNLLYTEDFKTNELDLPNLIKPKKSLLINI